MQLKNLHLHKLLVLSYLRGVGAVYLLVLFPNRTGRRLLKAEKKRHNLSHSVLVVKIGVTHRKKGRRLREIKKDMSRYGRVWRVPFSYFWMIGYTNKEKRLHRYYPYDFYPEQAGPAAGKKEWRLMSLGQLLLSWIMLFSYHFVFILLHVFFAVLTIGAFISDEAKLRLLEDGFDFFNLLLSV